MPEIIKEKKMIEIKEVKTKKDVKLFATYPLKLYKGCPYYVPSLRSDEMNTFNPKKNFSLKECDAKGFLCYKDGELAGRIAGIINRTDNELTGKKYIRFSRLECIDDSEVFKALLGAVEDFGKEHGMEIIHGPWGFNDTDREGMLTYGFDRVATYVTNYSYPYFCERMKELGFDDESKWLEKEFVIPDKPYERMLDVAKKVEEKIEVKDVALTMPLKDIVKQYGAKLFDTYNKAYAPLDGFVPVDELTEKNVLKTFATVLNKRYISILVDKNDEVAAFGVVIPSLVKPLAKHRGKLFPTGFIGILSSIKKPEALEMALIGVRPEYKNTGINAVVIAHIMNHVIEDGIKRIESNPMLETNYSIQQQWKFADCEVVKKRQTYQKPIGSLLEYSENIEERKDA